MKSTLSNKTDYNNCKGITNNSDPFDWLFSNVQADEVQFLPLKTEFERAVHTGNFNRVVRKQYVYTDDESFPTSLDDCSEISSEFSKSSVENEDKDKIPELKFCEQYGSKEDTDEKVQVNFGIDGALSLQRNPPTDNEKRNNGQYKELETINNDCKHRFNRSRSICLFPTLLGNMESTSYATCKKQKKYKTNSFILKPEEGKYDPLTDSTLQGRTEIFPRRSRMYQKQGFNMNGSFKTTHSQKFSEKNKEISKINWEDEVPQRLHTRVGKSAERIVRSITVRNIESVKRIGIMNPRLIVKVFEKYLSEILDCNAKLLLGRINLGLIKREDYLLDDSFQFPDSNLAYYLNVENPFRALIYPSLVQDSELNQNEMSTAPERGDKPRREENTLKCDCAVKGNFCQCQPTKTQQAVKERNKSSPAKDNKICMCYEELKNIPKTDTAVKSPFEGELSSGCACNQPISIQQSIDQEFKKMGTIGSSLISGNEVKLKKKCDCGKEKSTMQTIGEGEMIPKSCSCAKKFKKRIKPRSRSRNKSVISKGKSKKQKCDCVEPCEPTAPILTESNQPKKNGCECIPYVKNQDEEIHNSLCSPPESPLYSKPQCPCPCKELIQMKSAREGYISANPYGKKENKKLCVCQSNRKIMKSQKTAHNFLPTEDPLIIFKTPEGEKASNSHMCDICKLIEGLGAGTDHNLSLSTFASSEFDQIAGILRDTRNEILSQQNEENKLVSNIKCFRNSSGIICQSELIGSPITGNKDGKVKTNTIEIRIKYPRNQDVNKEKHCTAACTNTDPFKNDTNVNLEKTDNDTKCCDFFLKLQKTLSSCCTKPTTSDLSMLLDSLARKNPVICQTTQCIRSDSKVNVSSREGKPYSLSDECERRSSCFKSKASGDDETHGIKDLFIQSNEKINITTKTYKDRDEGVCSTRKNTISCQTTSCEDHATSSSTKKDIQCLFRREKPSSSPANENSSNFSRRRSSDSLQSWTFKDDKAEIQTVSCSKDSCLKLVNRPKLVVKKTSSLLECDMKGSCIRQKLFDKIFPNRKQPCRIPSEKDIVRQPSTRNNIPREKNPAQPLKDSQKEKKKFVGKATPASKGSKKNTSLPVKNISSKKNVTSKPSSNKNVTPQGKPSNSQEYFKSKKKDGFELDTSDQTTLSLALDAFFYRKAKLEV